MPWGKSRRCPLTRRVSVLQRRCEHFLKELNFLLLPGVEPQIVQAASALASPSDSGERPVI